MLNAEVTPDIPTDTWTFRVEGEVERNGYHDRGDPWREQRYQGD